MQRGPDREQVDAGWQFNCIKFSLQNPLPFKRKLKRFFKHIFSTVFFQFITYSLREWNSQAVFQADFQTGIFAIELPPRKYATDVVAVIFVADASAYDVVKCNGVDPSTGEEVYSNKLLDTLDSFKKMWVNPLLKKKSVILLLNKQDLLEAS